MVDFLNVYSPYLSAAVTVAVVVQMFFFHRAGSRIEAEYREVMSPNVRFSESRASGRRKKPFTFGGARNVLEVTVTDRELCIKGKWPIFTALGRRFGVTHRVLLANLRGLTQKGHMAEFSFIDESGSECVLELQLKQAAAFKTAVSRVA